MVLPSTINKIYSQTVKLYNLPTLTSVISHLSMSLQLHNLIRIYKNQHMYCQNKLCHLVNQNKRQLLNSSDIRSHSKNKIVKKKISLIDKPSPSDEKKDRINATREANTKLLSSIQENDLRHFLSSGSSFQKHDNERIKTNFLSKVELKKKSRNAKLHNILLRYSVK